MTARTPGSETKTLFRLATSPAKLDDIDGSLDDLVNKLRTLKEQDMYMSSTLPRLLLLTSEARRTEGKRERPDGLRTLQQRIEQVKVEINKLDEEHKKLKRESRELDAQINEVDEELHTLKAEKALYEKHRSKAQSRGRKSLLSGFGFLVGLALVFVLALLVLEVALWQTGRDDFLPELYHAHFRSLINHHWPTHALSKLHQLTHPTNE